MLWRAIRFPTASDRAHHRHERVRHEHTVFLGYMPLPKRWRYRILPTAPSSALFTLFLFLSGSGTRGPPVLRDARWLRGVSFIGRFTAGVSAGCCGIRPRPADAVASVRIHGRVNPGGLGDSVASDLGIGTDLTSGSHVTYVRAARRQASQESRGARSGWRGGSGLSAREEGERGQC
jgi:hypothetical protein